MKTLMDRLPGIVYRCVNDHDWTMQFLSKGCYELLGYYPEDLIQNKKVSYGSLIEKSDRKYVHSEIQKAIKQHKSFILKYRIRTASGQLKWVWEQGIGVFSNNGKLEALEGYITEITETRALEQEAKYRLLIENINDGVVISQYDKFIFFNNQFAKMLGYDLDELLMKDYRDVYTERGLEVLQERKAHRDCGVAVSSQYETVFKKKNGDEIEIGANVAIIDYKGDKATFAVIRDISERKKVEKEIRTQKQYFEALFNSTADAIVSLDQDDCIVNVNKQFETMFEYKIDEIKGENIDNIIVPKEKRQDAKNITKLVQRGGIALSENKRQRKDGTLVDVSIGGAPIIVGEKQIGILATYRDITERKKAEKERERIILKLQDALNRVKTLSGLIPICAGCKKIRDDQGYWSDVELYISKHSEAEFSHGLCNECMEKLYPEQYKRLKEEGKLSSQQ